MLKALFDRKELVARLTNFQSRLRAEEMDGAVVMQRADLLYYTGAAFQGALLVPANGDAAIYAWRAASRIGAECPAQIRTAGNMVQAVRALADSEFRSWKHIGLEEDVLPVAIWKLFTSLWPRSQYSDVSPLIRWQRTVKSEIEIGYIRRAADISVNAFTEIRRFLKPGVPENEIQMELERAQRRGGHQGLLRIRGYNGEAIGIVACGESANAVGVFDGPIGETGVNPSAPVGAGVRPLERNAPILIDSGAVFNGYHADMTRTYVIGKLPAKLEQAHKFCCALLDEIGTKLVPGAIPRDLYELALKRADQAGYREEFMNRGVLKAKFLGHGVGLELDEWPVITKSFTQPLEENMVLAIEPKIIFDEGAVGVEDTFLVTKNGGDVITKMERHVIQADNLTS